MALLNLLALEDFHQCRRNIGVVVHDLPFPLFTPVDVRDPPINGYRFVSELRLAILNAQCVRRDDRPSTKYYVEVRERYDRTGLGR